MNMTEHIDEYFGLVARTLDGLDRQSLSTLVEMIIQTCDAGGMIFIFGNGGSAATASHICGDFVKGISYGCRKKLRAMCLTDNTAAVLAIANDVCYQDIFVEQLANYLKPEDLVIGISGSGNSENVVRAVEYARQVGAATVGFCGFSGGLVKQIADLAIHANVGDMEVAEDIHMIVAHCVKRIIINRFQEQGAYETAESACAGQAVLTAR